MLASILWAPLFNFLIAHTASANSAASLFDNSAYGQAEWNRYCSSSKPQPVGLLPHACFVIHDDVTTATHSASHDKLGFASASGQGQDSKVEFFASGFWLRITFSDSTGCAKVEVRAPMRTPRRRKGGEEPALVPFSDGFSCPGAERKAFSL
ncbi:hypothetical protein [Sporisorium scitamineum]|uniref:Uncharacterized protein n=1 Tax=Sporisorium scitamineum TaxID=49012 RepID=A0A0F7S1B4_9BASI|nr:hypothetical protein [Sporisorium scitamineum]